MFECSKHSELVYNVVNLFFPCMLTCFVFTIVTLCLWSFAEDEVFTVGAEVSGASGGRAGV